MKHSKNKLINYFYCCRNWFRALIKKIRLFILGIPHNYLSKEQLEKLNDSIVPALKREKQIFNSIDYLVVEAAASGYFDSETVYLISLGADKKELKGLFDSLKYYKQIVEDNYYSMTAGDIVEIPFNLLGILKDLQDELNFFLNFLANVRENAHIPDEKLHFDVVS